VTYHDCGYPLNPQIVEGQIEGCVSMALGQTLAELDLFEPWELKFNISGTSIELPDLLIVRQKSLDTGALAPVLYRHGLVAAHLIGVHRISLFRAGILLAAARAVLHGETSAESGASDDG